MTKVTVAELGATNDSNNYFEFHVAGLHNNESFK
jgi:hypothetical protein